MTMIKLGDVISEAVIPRLSGDKKALTVFETHLKTCLSVMQNSEYACLVVDLLSQQNAEGFDYSFIGIPLGCNPWNALNYFQKPVIVLNAFKGFDEQWPEDIRGTVNNPRELSDKPIFCIPDYRDDPTIIPLFAPRA